MSSDCPLGIHRHSQLRDIRSPGWRGVGWPRWGGVWIRVGCRLDIYDTGAKTILLKWFRFLNGARTDTFFKIKSKTFFIVKAKQLNNI